MDGIVLNLPVNQREEQFVVLRTVHCTRLLCTDSPTMPYNGNADHKVKKDQEVSQVLTSL